MKTAATEEKVFSYMEEYHMVNAGDHVVAGISGGADSVCLLFLLLKYQKRVPFSITVVHVNHKIRKEAESDAAFVEALCKAHQIPFYLYEEDVEALAEKEGLTCEEAGRKVRYAAFYEIAEKVGGNKVAVAHNQNDLAETMLFHLFRGSDLKGIAGILPVRDLIIRPLLCLGRHEIEQYLEYRGQDFCKDATNEQDDYTRNRIRHHILPFAEEQLVSGAVEHLAQSANRLALAEDYLRMQTEEARKQCTVRKEGRIYIHAETFCTFHKVIQNRLLYALLVEISPQQKDISSVHVDLLRALFEKDSGKSVHLPFGIRAVREYEYIVLGMIEEESAVEARKEIPILLSEIDEVGKEFVFQGKRFLVRRMDVSNLQEKSLQIPQNQYTKWFDCAKMKQSLMLRNRQTNDYFEIRDKEGMLHHKSLKDYMITEKIPRSERDMLPVFAEGQHVLWIVGHRISEAYKIQEETKEIIQIQVINETHKSKETEDKNGGAC